MGEDARWVCHTCKTVCNRGGKHIWNAAPPLELCVATVATLKDMVASFSLIFDITSQVDRSLDFLNDLQEWLQRHESHNILVSTDYAMDWMDLDDYRNESVDGKVSAATRLEMRTKSVDDWRATRIGQIKQVIQNYGPVEPDTLDQVAMELYDKFSSKEI